jgi:pilus assembly protein Flp/PilA
LLPVCYRWRRDWFEKRSHESVSATLRNQIQSAFRFQAHIGPMQAIRRFLADESGATAIEYGLIAAGISLAIIAVVNGIGSHLNTKFSSINTSLK